MFPPYLRRIMKLKDDLLCKQNVTSRYQKVAYVTYAIQCQLIAYEVQRHRGKFDFTSRADIILRRALLDWWHIASMATNLPIGSTPELCVCWSYQFPALTVLLARFCRARSYFRQKISQAIISMNSMYLRSVSLHQEKRLKRCVIHREQP